MSRPIVFSSDELFLWGKPHDDGCRVSICLADEVDGGAFVNELLLGFPVSNSGLATREVIGLQLRQGSP